jgi:hypothetical protein
MDDRLVVIGKVIFYTTFKSIDRNSVASVAAFKTMETLALARCQI